MLRLDVIGSPIDHSKSPLIHGTVLDSLGITFDYRKVEVKKGGLLEYINDAKEIGVSGFNLTMPHKIDILPYLDYIDEEAKSFGSVNTVVIKSGRLFGYNTDGRGFVLAMEDLGFSPKGKRIVFLGAGGVVLPLALKSAQLGAKSITILNRTVALAQSLSQKLCVSSRALGLTSENLRLAAADCDILVNATPLGMEGIAEDFEDLSFLDNLHKGALVYDLIYSPEETSLLKAAKKRRLCILNGMPMLAYQGIFADEYFLDSKLDCKDLRDKIEFKLKNLKK